MSYMIYFSFKGTPNIAWIEGLKEEFHVEIGLYKQDDLHYLLGDGQTSHALIIDANISDKTVKVHPVVLKFFHIMFIQNIFPSMWINYADKKYEKSDCCIGKVKLLESELSPEYDFTERYKYTIVGSHGLSGNQY